MRTLTVGLAACLLLLTACSGDTEEVAATTPVTDRTSTARATVEEQSKGSEITTTPTEVTTDAPGDLKATDAAIETETEDEVVETKPLAGAAARAEQLRVTFRGSYPDRIADGSEGIVCDDEVLDEPEAAVAGCGLTGLGIVFFVVPIDQSPSEFAFDVMQEGVFSTCIGDDYVALVAAPEAAQMVWEVMDCEFP